MLYSTCIILHWYSAAHPNSTMSRIIKKNVNTTSTDTVTMCVTIYTALLKCRFLWHNKLHQNKPFQNVLFLLESKLCNSVEKLYTIFTATNVWSPLTSKKLGHALNSPNSVIFWVWSDKNPIKPYVLNNVSMATVEKAFCYTVIIRDTSD